MALAFVITVALVLQCFIYNRWISLLDEVAILQIADQINHGGVLYRDAVHVAFPGIFYLTAALFRLFGPSIVIGRQVMVVVFAAFVVLVYLLARTIAGRGAALGAALLAVAYRMWAFPHWQMLSYTPLAVVMVTAAVAVLALDIRRPGTAWPPLAGLAVGLGVVFKQDCSTVVFLGLAGFVFATAYRRAGTWRGAVPRTASYVVAAALPTIVSMLAFARAGLLVEMLWQTIWFPLVAQPVWAPSFSGESVSYIDFPSLWPPFEADLAIRKIGFFSYFPSLFLDLYWKEFWNHPLFVHTPLPEIFVRGVYVLPFVLIIVFVAHELLSWWIRRRDGAAEIPQHTRHLRLLLVFAVALILSFNRPRDWIHLMVLYPATLVLLAGLTELLAGTAPGFRRRAVYAAGTTVLAVVLAASFALAFATVKSYDTPLATPRAGIRVAADVATALNPLLQTLAPPPGTDPAPLASLPYNPVLNFLAQRPLATRFLTVLPLEEFPDRQEQILSDLTRVPRTEIVYSLHHLASIPRPQDYAPRLFSALVERYQLGSGPGMVFNGARTDGLLFVRLEPRSPRDETVLFDFSQHLDEARVAEIDSLGDERARPVSDDRVGIEMWPFESPVIAMFTAVRPARTRLTFSVDVPARTRLRFGAAVDPDEWTHFLPSELRFVVRIDGAVVFDTRLDPRRDFEDRRWVWVDLPVPGAGRRTIAFEVSSENAYATELRLAGWARPRLVAAPED